MSHGRGLKPLRSTVCCSLGHEATQDPVGERYPPRTGLADGGFMETPNLKLTSKGIYVEEERSTKHITVN